jgi:hypothetical protein
MGNIRYHPDHFACSYCKKKLIGGQYHKNQDKPYVPCAPAYGHVAYLPC